mgnify:CR=1 FL=1
MNIKNFFIKFFTLIEILIVLAIISILASILSYAFRDIIDEFRVYNRALSDAEIKALYDATK